ncbi:MAG TPA: aminodeoxychorismate/anthranilate synthase component II [Thermosynergistes sp.]|nr:aminodeoxychorismate/anthranilate synthase component II [Thermosynergistes sp.]HXK89536.1 aminodeoxychorismate/anthranilate synthase component II [Thermosynergistes sp.]
MILVIDNYDSFTYNLVQLLSELEAVEVVRNDAVSLEDIEAAKPSHIVISPGPGRPEDAGICEAAIKNFCSRIPILGVCLGHQCIAQAFGGRVRRARKVFHGKTSLIYHDGVGIFCGLPSPFKATRYHSLEVDESSVPEELRVAAWTDEGEVMAIRHKNFPLWGLQFHPESFLTEVGMEILKNFTRRDEPRGGI